MKKKKKRFLKRKAVPVFVFELALICILSAAACGPKIIANENILSEEQLDSAEAVSEENAVEEDGSEKDTAEEGGSEENTAGEDGLEKDTAEEGGSEENTAGEEISEKDTTTAEISKDAEEMRAVWISYIEFSDELDRLNKKSFSKKNFQNFIDTMFDNCVSWNMNTVIVHVRPYGDAMYPSKYFPWSAYVSGKQGKNPGFDPLEYMVKAAHERGLKFEAWINPYRIATGTTKASSLAKGNPARKWLRKNSRNVLSFGGNLYYNPAKKEVRELITNGVREIVENYDVDGIHFDDYFYPSLGKKAKPSSGVSASSYGSYFDYKEYVSYQNRCKKQGKTALSLVKWRRNNVSTLVSMVYSAVKDENPDVTFGISPAGNISNLLSKHSYFVDIKTWMSEKGYVDYICPQVYWTFRAGEEAFDKVVQEWISYDKGIVKLYIGIAVYKAAAGKNSTWDWKQWHNKTTILKRQILYCRKQKEIDGFSFFSYQNFLQKSKRKEVKNLLGVLK